MSDAARRILLAILLIGTIGITVELLLLGHDEDFNQLIPLAMSAATLITGVLISVKPGVGTVRLFQVVAVLLIGSGALGMYFHFRATSEFQLEMDPSLAGWALFRKAILAKAPPALAPGAMTQLGLIALACTFRHPALQSGRKP
ncbi:MAG: hypothetical protein ABI024_01605 [Vicinamibacterales bacterium]